jgi:hypothetical protein
VKTQTRTVRSTKPASKSSHRPAAGRSNAAARVATPAAAGAPSYRKFYVFLSLVGLLSFTSILLLALAPAPLMPGSAGSLFAIDAPKSLDAIFTTTAPVQDGRWRYVFVHHSQTASGNAATLANRPGGLSDHFVIGNGNGCIDGEIQIGQRWVSQLPAGRSPGIDKIDPNCVSICLIGDFNVTRPSPTQQVRLAQLVNTLQARLQIPRDRIIMLDGNSTRAGTGRQFPVADFKEKLLP